jgi:serine/threonine protein kinase
MDSYHKYIKYKHKYNALKRNLKGGGVYTVNGYTCTTENDSGKISKGIVHGPGNANFKCIMKTVDASTIEKYDALKTIIGYEALYIGSVSNRIMLVDSGIDMFDYLSLIISPKHAAKFINYLVDIYEHMYYHTLYEIQKLHEKNIIHNDVKLKNFLINTTGVVRLIDFDESIININREKLIEYIFKYKITSCFRHMMELYLSPFSDIYIYDIDDFPQFDDQYLFKICDATDIWAWCITNIIMLRIIVKIPNRRIFTYDAYLHRDCPYVIDNGRYKLSKYICDIVYLTSIPYNNIKCIIKYKSQISKLYDIVNTKSSPSAIHDIKKALEDVSINTLCHSRISENTILTANKLLNTYMIDLKASYEDDIEILSNLKCVKTILDVDVDHIAILKQYEQLNQSIFFTDLTTVPSTFYTLLNNDFNKLMKLLKLVSNLHDIMYLYILLMNHIADHKQSTNNKYEISDIYEPLTDDVSKSLIADIINKFNNYDKPTHITSMPRAHYDLYT